MTALAPPYLSGLLLAGRSVVVLGGGVVAGRRLVRLLRSSADIRLIAPDVSAPIAERVSRGELTWTRRRYRRGDLAGAWYVLVATDDEACNREASAEAEESRIFCVRADAASESTAWTPATGDVDGLVVGVLAGGDARRAKHARDALVEHLRTATATAPARRA